LFASLFVGCDQQQVSKKFKGMDIDLSDSAIVYPVRNNQNLVEFDLTNAFNRTNLDAFEDFSQLLLDDYKLVFFETTDDCLIGEIKKVICFDSLIFVHDPYIANKLLLFNDKRRNIG
jgi:hypothetical protein